MFFRSKKLKTNSQSKEVVEIDQIDDTIKSPTSIKSSTATTENSTPSSFPTTHPPIPESQYTDKESQDLFSQQFSPKTDDLSPPPTNTVSARLASPEVIVSSPTPLSPLPTSATTSNAPPKQLQQAPLRVLDKSGKVIVTHEKETLIPVSGGALAFFGSSGGESSAAYKAIESTPTTHDHTGKKQKVDETTSISTTTTTTTATNPTTHTTTAVSPTSLVDPVVLETPSYNKHSYYARTSHTTTNPPTPTMPLPHATRYAIPNGKPGCLNTLKIAVTGEFESNTRDEIEHLVLKYGGKLAGAVSGKTNYLVIGTMLEDGRRVQVSRSYVCMYNTCILCLYISIYNVYIRSICI